MMPNLFSIVSDCSTSRSSGRGRQPRNLQYGSSADSLRSHPLFAVRTLRPVVGHVPFGWAFCLALSEDLNVGTSASWARHVLSSLGETLNAITSQSLLLKPQVIGGNALRRSRTRAENFRTSLFCFGGDSGSEWSSGSVNPKTTQRPARFSVSKKTPAFLVVPLGPEAAPQIPPTANAEGERETRPSLPAPC
jgi:hypothetical protein